MIGMETATITEERERARLYTISRPSLSTVTQSGK
jgi:hypothetical protein